MAFSSLARFRGRSAATSPPSTSGGTTETGTDDGARPAKGEATAALKSQTKSRRVSITVSSICYLLAVIFLIIVRPPFSQESLACIGAVWCYAVCMTI